MGKNYTIITATEIAQAFLLAVGEKCNLDCDPVMGRQSQYDPVQKVAAFFGCGTPNLRFVHAFPSKQDQRQIGLQTLVNLGAGYNKISGALSRTEELHDLKVVLADVPKTWVRQALEASCPH